MNEKEIEKIKEKVFKVYKKNYDELVKHNYEEYGEVAVKVAIRDAIDETLTYLRGIKKDE